MGEVVEVALPFSLPYPLLYYSEKPFEEVFGRRVLVPLKKKVVVGCVIGRGKGWEGEIKGIKHVIDEKPLLEERDIQLARWLSRRYFYPLGMVLKHFFPPAFFVDTGGVFVFSGNVLQGFEELVGFVKGRRVTKRELVRLFGKDLVNDAIDKGVLIPDPGPRARDLVKKRKIYRAVPGRSPSKGRKKKVYEYLLSKGEAGEEELKRELKVTKKTLETMREEGFLEVKEVEVLYQGFRDETVERIPGLSEEQREVVKNILSSKENEHLIFGVTGSGKTYCFLEVAKDFLEKGRQVLIVVPEVGLTPQMLRRVEGYFQGKRLGLYHSYLTDRERALTWFRAFDGDVDLVLGTRSSIFLPLRRLGLIVIDEEHDDSLSQESGLKYDVREVASYMAERWGVKVIYSSATPSFTTYFRAKKGKIFLHKLEKRYGDVELPKVELIDMRGEGRGVLFSERLVEKIGNTLEKGHQVIVFHTRRGYSPYALCTGCGYTFKCVNCSLTLVYHRSERVFRCHWCGYEEKGKDRCPRCGGYDIRFYGSGSEKVEEELKRLFPGARVERLDSDITRKRYSLTDILFRFYRREIDILVGTNMVVKGHDFPGVRLVCVTGTDNILNLPDYKAAERNFQILTQVSGRSGRKEKGEVVIQTYNPQHYSIQYVLQHDYEGFFEREMEFRKRLSYPPFKDVLLMVLKGKEKKSVKEFGDKVKAFLEEKYFNLPRIGPIPAPVPRLKGLYRMIVLIKGEKEKLIELGWDVLKSFKSSSIELTINPETLLV